MALTGVAQLVGSHPTKQKVEVHFLVRAHAWVLGQVPSGGHARGNQWMFLSHIHVTLPLFLPLFPSKNKYNLKRKKKGSL